MYLGSGELEKNTGLTDFFLPFGLTHKETSWTGVSTEGENLGAVITVIVFSKTFSDAKIITKVPFGQHGDFGKDV